MQITGSNSFIPLRQPSSMAGGQEGQRLVFLYPIMCDMTLSKYQNDIRDLINVDFIGQIKTSNVLNIITDSTRIGTIGHSTNALNPAEEVRRNLRNVAGPNSNAGLHIPDYQSYYHGTFDSTTADRYQYKIDSFLRFIKNQLEHDPRYKSYRPMISSISLTENLINIPLIIGTKLFPVESQILYWMLLLGVAFNIPLDSQNNLNKIRNLYESIPEESRMKVLYDPEYRSKALRNASITGAKIDNYKPSWYNQKKTLAKSISNYNLSHSLSPLSHNISDRLGSRIGMQMAILSKCVNRRLWDVETDGLNTDTDKITKNTIGTITTETQRYHFQKAFGSFQSYLGSLIVPLLYGLENLLGPIPTNGGTSTQQLVDDFIQDNTVDRLTGDYIELSNHVTNYMRGITSASSDMIAGGGLKPSDLKRLDNIIKEIKGICEANVEMTDGIQTILDHLGSARLPVNFNGSSLSHFLDIIVQSAGRLKGYSHTIETWILSLLQDNTNIPGLSNEELNQFKNTASVFTNKCNNIKSAYLENIDAFVNAFYSSDQGIRQCNQNKQHEFEQRFQNFRDLICGGDWRNCCSQLSAILDEVTQAIADISYFLFIWNFLSYMCSYMQDIEIDIKIQKRDVLDFPNYCLVVPIEIVRYIYNWINISNFKSLLMSNSHTDLRPSENVRADHNDIKKMVEVFTARLKIPNIIIINSKKNELIYKFMYMSRHQKATLEQIKSYTSHQNDVLPGF